MKRLLLGIVAVIITAGIVWAATDYKLQIAGSAVPLQMQGQAIKGNSTAGGNLTLTSTDNATKGKLLFGTSAYNEVNNRLGLGTTDPRDSLYIANTGPGISLYDSDGPLNKKWYQLLVNNAQVLEVNTINDDGSNAQTPCAFYYYTPGASSFACGGTIESGTFAASIPGGGAAALRFVDTSAPATQQIWYLRQWANGGNDPTRAWFGSNDGTTDRPAWIVTKASGSPTLMEIVPPLTLDSTLTLGGPIIVQQTPWTDAFKAKGLQRMALAANSYPNIQEYHFCGVHDLASVVNGTGSVTDANRNGCQIQLSTGGTGGGYGYLKSVGGTGIQIDGASTAFYFAVRAKMTTAVTADTNLTLGLFDQYSIGICGGASTTKYAYAQGSGTCNNTTLSTVTVDTSMHDFEVWRTNGGSCFFAVDGMQTTASGCSGANASVHFPLFQALNPSANNTTHTMIVDEAVFMTERN